MSIVERRPWRLVSRLAVGGSLVMAGSFGALALSTGTAHAAATCGDSTETVCPAISLSDIAPAAGGSEQVSGTGYAADETVTVALDSTTLGTISSDGAGDFTYDTTIPGATTAGSHTITGTDSDGNTASAGLTVSGTTTSTGAATTGTGTDASTGTGSELPVTGGDITKGLLVAADLALLGIPLTVVARRRKA